MLYKLSNPYRTQRNNLIDPTQTCQVTSMIMALEASGISFEYPKNEQPEDYLARLLDEPDAWAKLKKEYPAMAGRPPREVHAILSWAVNEKLCKRRVTTFTTKVSTQEILWRLARHKCASVVSGRFTSYGHLVAVIGFETKQERVEDLWNPYMLDLDKIEAIIVDDPFGNSKTGYKDTNGNDVYYSLQEFVHLTRIYDSFDIKWAHLFSKDGIF